jgi:hypothetical protein
MPPAEFEPEITANVRPQTHVLHRSATDIGNKEHYLHERAATEDNYFEESSRDSDYYVFESSRH